jgi:hypothetical protein
MEHIGVRSPFEGDSSGISIEGWDVRDVVDFRPSVVLFSVWEDVLRDGAAVDVRVERVVVDKRAGMLSSLPYSYSLVCESLCRCCR